MSGFTWHDFWAMGGYADYVWPAYAVFFAVLVIDAVVPALRRRRIERELRAELVRQSARRGRRSAMDRTDASTGDGATPPRSA